MANTLKIKRSSVENKRPLTTDLELGELAINTFDGKLFLKRNDGLQDYVVEVGGNVGFEVKNQTGSTLTKGTVVGFVGTLGASGKLLVAPYLANGSQPSEYIVGLIEDNIPNGGDGFAIDHGKIFGMNTSAYSSGTILYASSTVAGGFTATRPLAPNNKIILAAVINSHQNVGVLEVRLGLGSNLGNDELVELSTLSDKQILAYNSTNARFENTAIKTINNQSLIGSGNLSITGGSSAWVVKTANYTLVNSDRIIANTSGGSFTLTLPSSPSAGDAVTLADGGDWSTNNLILARNGSTIEGVSSDLSLDIKGIQVELIYSGSTWEVYAFTGPAELPPQSGQSGKYLTTDGTNTNWSAAPGGVSLDNVLALSIALG